MTDILQCSPMRAAESNTPPAFAMPPGACDAHFHVFERSPTAPSRPTWR
jgi:2-pyrone-4,6-dicarboxylate lactonase